MHISTPMITNQTANGLGSSEKYSVVRRFANCLSWPSRWFMLVANVGLATVASTIAMAQTLPVLRMTDIHGQTWNGSFESIDQDKLVYLPSPSASAEPNSLKTSELMRLERSGKIPSSIADAASANWKARLSDGTVLSLQQIEGKEKRWMIRLADGVVRSEFDGELKSLKFKKLDAKAEEAWQAFEREELKSDALIVVRPGGALDRVDGLVKEIKDGKIQFDVDGQIVDASIDRLAGVLWYRKPQEPKGQGASTAGFVVQLLEGSSILADRAKVVGTELELGGQWTNALRVPMDWLQSIDCGLGKIAWLSSLATLDARPTGRGGFGEFDAILAKTTKPRWIRGELGINEDLLFPGPGEYQFRAPAGMTKLQARVERSGDSESRSAIQIEVWVDDQVALRKEIGADEQGLDLEIGIAQEKKIKLVLGSKSPLHLGTRALVKQAKLLK